MNTFSGLLGAAIGIWVSIEVVQVALDNRQKEEWQMVRELVYNTIESQLAKSCLEYVSLGVPLGPYVGLLDDVGRATEEKLALISKLYKEVSELEGAIHKGQYIELQSLVRSHLDRLFDFQLYNVTLPGRATSLVEQLIHLERASRNWDDAVFRNTKLGISEKALAQKANDTLAMLLKTYQQLV